LKVYSHVSRTTVVSYLGAGAFVVRTILRSNKLQHRPLYLNTSSCSLVSTEHSSVPISDWLLVGHVPSLHWR